jgi:hypothetical protein
LHHEEGLPVVAADVEDGDQSRMVQAGQYEGFVLEPVLQARAGARPEDLDRHRTAEP